MKKIILSAVALIGALTLNAQVRAPSKTSTRKPFQLPNEPDFELAKLDKGTIGLCLLANLF